jgi:probable phosphoglycerate mutase
MEELDELFRLRDEDATELLLVRHAEPESREHPAQSALSRDGVLQARLLAERLSAHWIEAVYTGPELPTMQTASVVAEVLGRPLTALDDLREIEYQPFLAEALMSCVRPAYGELFQRRPRWDSLPGFEPSRDFRRRAIQAIESAVAEHAARRIVIVTHGSVINAYLSMLLDIPRDLFFLPGHASISVVRSLRDLYAVRSLNDTSHLKTTCATA